MDTIMRVNYHTHTGRCHHAYGTEKEYVEKAIEAGMEVLGFSDHAPYPYPDGYEASHKMLPSQLEDYVDTVLDLRREYKGQIEVRLGLEAEYYPALWEDFLCMIEPYPIEYLLLGQHFLGNEYDDPVYCGNSTGSSELLHRYCIQCMEALETGEFLYFAHPDLLPFTGDAAVYETEMTKLCRYCCEKEIPIELNLLGLGLERNYPDSRFWSIAGREGCMAVIGADAHRPQQVYSPPVIRKAERFLRRHGFGTDRIIERLELKRQDEPSSLCLLTKCITAPVKRKQPY